MSEMTHDVSQLTEAAGATEVEATAAVVDVLTTTLVVAAHNDCWGTDALGGAFAHRYLTPATTALEAIQASSYQLGEVATKLTQTAQAYQATEETNTDASRGVNA